MMDTKVPSFSTNPSSGSCMQQEPTNFVPVIPLCLLWSSGPVSRTQLSGMDLACLLPARQHPLPVPAEGAGVSARHDWSLQNTIALGEILAGAGEYRRDLCGRWETRAPAQTQVSPSLSPGYSLRRPPKKRRTQGQPQPSTPPLFGTGERRRKRGGRRGEKAPVGEARSADAAVPR